MDTPSPAARPAAPPAPIVVAVRGPEHAHRHFRPIGLAQEAKQNGHTLRGADRALKDATQAGQGTLFYDHLIARLEGMRRQTPLFVDPAKFGLDQLDRLIRDYGRLAIEAQNMIEPRNPLQSGNARAREVAPYKKVGRKQRNSAFVRARNQKRQKCGETASRQGLRHPVLGVRLGVQGVPGFHDLPES